MLKLVTGLFETLSSPGLAPRILLALGGLATTIIVTGVGLWVVVDACKLFVYLMRATGWREWCERR
jgi:hypothetical protein